MGRPKKQENTGIIYIRLPLDIIKAIRESAEHDRREISATVRVILEKHYEHKQP